MLAEQLIGDGFAAALEALGRGIEPDPELWVDEWAETHMVLPRGIAAEHGPYRVDRTPMAREIMRCLSPGHPCKRVVVVGASQMLKTQVGLNWLAGSIDQAPANFLLLAPTGNLAKRISSRIDKTIRAVDRLRSKVAAHRSRDSRNTVDTKEFVGGTLYITTAGSASNLAEIPARYVWEDELDRFEGDVDGEGDPDRLAEARTSTFNANKKIYKSSSPTWAGRSRIWKWFERGTQHRCELPCPHCGEYHELVLENFHWDEPLTRAWFVCPHCGGVIEESDKAVMLRLYRWRATAPGDGETESFHVSAFYAPLGWHSWLMLAREYVEALRDEADGDTEPLQAFYNTRLALCFELGRETADEDDLIARGEDYPELTAPAPALVVTVGVDVQHDRIAISIWAWGRGEEGWLVYWGELPGQTVIAGRGAWSDLEKFLFEFDGAEYRPRAIRHESGAALRWRRCSVDCGDGTITQDAAYSFCRKHRRRGVMAVKGGSERGGSRLEIFSPPKLSVDTNPHRRNKADRYGLAPYIVGTQKAKDLLLEARLPLCERSASGISTGRGPGRLHWYRGVRADFHAQLLSEVKMPSRTRRGVKVWEKKAGCANEAIDTLVYAFHAARSLKLNTWSENNWLAIEQQIRQAELLETDAVKPTQTQSVTDDKTQQPMARAARDDASWIDVHDDWLSEE
ncbi:MAG: phage terminase large subunit family protein [Sinobacteraceae bacterium]|nr:phage terminase large subunit family protein [Nevskiaceae bacterium]